MTKTSKSSPGAKGAPKKGAISKEVSTPKKGASSPVRATTPKKGHPTFAAMICEAIGDIEGTVSRLAIAKWIKEHYDVSEATFANHLKNGFAKAEEEGRIVKVKASYKLKGAKKAKDEASKKTETPKKKAAKRKPTTPKSKQAAKKRRAEKESASEEERDEEEDVSQEEEEATVDEEEGSQAESDAGPIQDITVEEPVKDESEDAEAGPVKAEKGSKTDKSPATSGKQPPEVQAAPTATSEAAIERSGEPAAIQDQPKGNLVATGELSIDAQKPEQAVESSGETSSLPQPPKVSDAESVGEGAAEVPPLKSGEGEIAAEATEKDADAAVITSVPIVQEADGDSSAFSKSAPVPGAADSMVVDTV